MWRPQSTASQNRQHPPIYWAAQFIKRWFLGVRSQLHPTFLMRATGVQHERIVLTPLRSRLERQAFRHRSRTLEPQVQVGKFGGLMNSLKLPQVRRERYCDGQKGGQSKKR